jgi:methionine-rich copper-binding protein CopC
MTRILFVVSRVVAVLAAIAFLTLTPATTLAHARYERSEPTAGGMVDATPIVLRAWFNQELMSASMIAVYDAASTQVDLGDGRVDLDDPDRKVMLVSLPELPPGVYTVHWVTLSAEDGDWADGTFTIGVGMMPPTGDPQTSPAGAAIGGQAATYTSGE